MKKLLLQLDTDKYASTFDRITAYEAGVDHVLSYGEVTVDDVQGLLHGVMFTRTIEERRQTAVFIGGRRVDLCEQILEEAKRSMFDPFCLSIMLDSNGCNTASAAAVALVKRHIELKGNKVAVLGGFGPVGLRAAKLLSGDGAKVYVTNLPRDLFTGKWNEQRARHDLGLPKLHERAALGLSRGGGIRIRDPDGQQTHRVRRSPGGSDRGNRNRPGRHEADF